MRLLPNPERMRQATAGSTNEGLGQGAEAAIGLLVFFGIGFAVDHFAGTTPIFMIALSVFFAIGQFVKMWYGYDLKMKGLEAQRIERASAHQTADRQGEGR
jgi:hypothetical protein